MYHENLLWIDCCILKLLKDLDQNLFGFPINEFALAIDKIKLLCEARHHYIESEPKKC